MKISDLKPGDVFYSVESGRMGNTTAYTTSVYKVVIEAVDHERADECFSARWNRNPAKVYYRVPRHWKRQKPVLIKQGLGDRLATKAEREAGNLRDCGLYMRVEAKREARLRIILLT